MPRLVTLFNVFLSCPSEMTAERTVIEKAIDEANLDLTSAAYFRPLHWQRDALPAVADEPQQAINSQLLSIADVLCAIFSSRLGSPTKSYPSGSVEEIIRFLDSGKYALGGHFVQVYFKREPVDPLTVDPVQLQELHTFRATLTQRGVFFRDFSDNEDLFSIVQRALRAAGSSVVPSVSQEKAVAPSALALTDLDADTGDDGFFDLMDEFNRNISLVGSALGHIGGSLEPMSEKFRQTTSVIEKTKGVGIDVPRLLSDLASSVQSTSDEISSSLDGAREPLADAMFALNRAISVLQIFEDGSGAAPGQLEAEIDAVMSSASTARQQMADLYEAVIAAPNLSRKLSRANSHLARSLQNVIYFIDESQSRFKSVNADLERLRSR